MELTRRGLFGMVAAAFVAKPLLEKLPVQAFDLFPAPATAYTVGVDLAAKSLLQAAFDAMAHTTHGLAGVAIRPSRLLVHRSWFERADHSLVVEESLYEELLRAFPSSATLGTCTSRASSNRSPTAS